MQPCSLYETSENTCVSCCIFKFISLLVLKSFSFIFSQVESLKSLVHSGPRFLIYILFSLLFSRAGRIDAQQSQEAQRSYRSDQQHLRESGGPREGNAVSERRTDSTLRFTDLLRVLLIVFQQLPRNTADFLQRLRATRPSTPKRTSSVSPHIRQHFISFISQTFCIFSREM